MDPIILINLANVRIRKYRILRITCFSYHFSKYCPVCILYFNSIVCRFKEYPISIFICRSVYRKNRNKLSAIGIDSLTLLFSSRKKSIFVFNFS